MTEPIGESNLGANEQPAVELKKVPLIGSADNVVVVENLFRRTNTVGECTPEISCVRAACEDEYRLLEIGLRRQLEGSEKIREGVFG
jgi:hypothetical protein